MVALVWIVFLAGAVSSGFKIGHATGLPANHAPFPPVNVAIFMVFFFFVATSAGPLLLRRRQSRWTGRLLDRVWGQGTSAAVIARVKPIALMACCCCTFGVVGLASTYAVSQSWTAYANSAVALSMGLGLAVAYSLSRKYPPTLL